MLVEAKGDVINLMKAIRVQALINLFTSVTIIFISDFIRISEKLYMTSFDI